uniref:Protein artemis n=1 Tax=Culex pipiens TaxID=7175 RepID=A0A8D8NRU3_CULPI
MSTFNGFIAEIPGISVDRFTEANRIKSNVFFLSHCHTDHMLGLQDPEPLPGPIYTSSISAVFLKHRYPQLAGCIRTLDLGTTSIDMSTGSYPTHLTVTTLPAGHCPGSVMFLFETERDRNILYTGDFRLSPKDLRSLLPLQSITLHVLYLDTTFFNRTYTYFPSQSESLAKIVQLTKEWLERDPRNVISFRLPALYGSEFLFIELARQLQQRIHVNAQEAQQYRYLASLDDAITSADGSRIHACLRTSNANYRKLPCQPELDPKYVRVLRPSALRWRNLKQGESYCWRLRKNEEEFGICYSNHASCGELEDFLRYLKPEEVRFNVVPKEEAAVEMAKLVEEICPRKEDDREELVDREEFSFAGIQYRKCPGKNSHAFSDEDSEEETVICQLPKRARS